MLIEQIQVADLSRKHVVAVCPSSSPPIKLVRGIKLLEYFEDGTEMVGQRVVIMDEAFSIWHDRGLLVLETRKMLANALDRLPNVFVPTSFEIAEKARAYGDDVDCHSYPRAVCLLMMPVVVLTVSWMVRSH